MISPAWVHVKIGALIEIRLSHNEGSRKFKSSPLQQPGRMVVSREVVIGYSTRQILAK
jgi:hypothetical protein